MENQIKTKLSKAGLEAFLFVFIPHLVILFPFPFFERVKVPTILFASSILVTLFTIFSLTFLVNSAKPFRAKSKLMNIAFISLSLYYIMFLEIFLLHNKGLIIAMSIFEYFFLLFFTLDRRNWIATAFVSLYSCLNIATIYFCFFK